MVPSGPPITVVREETPLPHRIQALGNLGRDLPIGSGIPADYRAPLDSSTRPWVVDFNHVPSMPVTSNRGYFDSHPIGYSLLYPVPTGLAADS